MKLFRRPATVTAAAPKEPKMPIRTSTYSFLHDEQAAPAPTPEPAALPDSLMMVEAQRIIAKAADLAGRADIVRHEGGSQPLDLIRVTAAAQRLALSAAAFGGPRDVAAAALASAAADSLEAAWLAGSIAPPPPPPPAPERVPAIDRGEHTAGRPHVGEVLHLDSEMGSCRVCWVVEIMAGKPAENVPVTAENPYIRVAPVDDPTRPTFARWISRPQPNLSPGYRPAVRSWHRGTPEECPGWSK